MRSYRNQSTELLSKSIDWFLYGSNFGVKNKLTYFYSSGQCFLFIPPENSKYFLPVFSFTVSIPANSFGQVETGSSRQVKNSNFFKTYFRRHSDVNRNLSGVLIVYLLTISGHSSLNIFPQNIRGNKKRSLV